jgi:hypothetical protein
MSWAHGAFVRGSEGLATGLEGLSAHTSYHRKGRSGDLRDILSRTWEAGPEAASTSAPGSTTDPCERPETVCSGAGVSVIMHEESTSVGHEGGIFVPLPSVLLMLTPATLGRRLGRGRGARAHNDRAGELGGGLRRLFPCLGALNIVEVHFLDRSRLIRNGQPVQHDVGIRRDRLVGYQAVGFPLHIVLSVYLARHLFDIGRRRRSVVDIARIAVIGRVVVIATDRTLGQGIVVELEGVGACLILIFDSTTMTDEFPAETSGTFTGHCRRVVDGGRNVSTEISRPWYRCSKTEWMVGDSVVVGNCCFTMVSYVVEALSCALVCDPSYCLLFFSLRQCAEVDVVASLRSSDRERPNIRKR